MSTLLPHRADQTEKPLVYYVPVASLIHVERVPGPILRSRGLLEDAGLKVFGPRKPVKSVKEVPAVDLKEFDAVVVFVASGGTGSLIADIVKDSGCFIWAYHENNSLPSALAAKEHLAARQNRGGGSRIIYNNLSEAPGEIVAEAFASKTLRRLRGLKLGYVGDDEESAEITDGLRTLAQTFTFETVFIPYAELREALSLVSKGGTSHVVKDRLKRAEMVEPSQEDVEKAVRLYHALKTLVEKHGLNIVTLDCYRYMKQSGVTPCLALSFLNDDGITAVCEGEIWQAPILFLASLLSGKPCWMADTAKLDHTSGIVTLAHCSAPLKLAEEQGVVRLRSHFECGMGVGMDVPLERGNITLAHLSRTPPTLTLAKGELLESQLSHWKLSRTQADVKLDCDTRSFFSNSGNHQALVYGDFVAVLERIGRRLGLTTTVLK